MACGDGGGDESGGVAKHSMTESSPDVSLRSLGSLGAGRGGFLGLGDAEALGGDEAPWLDAMQVRLAALEGVIVQLQRAKGPVPHQQPRPSAVIPPEEAEAATSEAPPFPLAEAAAAEAAKAAEARAEAQLEELRKLLLAEETLRVQTEQLLAEAQEKIMAQQLLLAQAENEAEERRAVLEATEQQLLDEQCRREAAEHALENLPARADSCPHESSGSVEVALAAEARAAAADARALAAEARSANLEGEVAELRRLAAAAAAAAAAVAAAAPQARRGRSAASSRSGTPTQHRLDRSGPRLGSPKMQHRPLAAKALEPLSTTSAKIVPLVSMPLTVDSVNSLPSDAVVASATNTNVSPLPPGEDEPDILDPKSSPKSSERLSVSSAEARAAVQEAQLASLRMQPSEEPGSRGAPRSTTPSNTRPSSVVRGSSRGPRSPPRTPQVERALGPSRSQPAIGSRAPSAEPRTPAGRQAPMASGRTPSSERWTASTLTQRPSEAGSRARRPSTERQGNGGGAGSPVSAPVMPVGLQPGAGGILAPVRNSLRRNQSDLCLGPSAGVTRRTGGVPAQVPGGAPRPTTEAAKNRAAAAAAAKLGTTSASRRR